LLLDIFFIDLFIYFLFLFLFLYDTLIGTKIGQLLKGEGKKIIELTRSALCPGGIILRRRLKLGTILQPMPRNIAKTANIMIGGRISGLGFKLGAVCD